MRLYDLNCKQLIYLMFIKKHQKRVKIWKKKFKINNYQLFWMGFGEGLLLGILISIMTKIILHKIYG